MESTAHANLKRLACLYLGARGFSAIGMEVRCPIGRHVVDVAGFGRRDGGRDGEAAMRRLVSARVGHGEGGLFGGAGGAEEADGAGDRAAEMGSGARRSGKLGRLRPTTVIVECKQARGDFLRERGDLDRLTALRSRLEGERVAMELEALRRDPTLGGQGEGHLFPGALAGRVSGVIGRDHRRVVGRLDRLDAQIHGGTKFSRMARYRLADHLYVLSPAGLLRATEVPCGWGLLECPGWVVRSRWSTVMGRIGESAAVWDDEGMAGRDARGSEVGFEAGMGGGACGWVPVRVARRFEGPRSTPRFRRRLLMRIAFADSQALLRERLGV
ncbi:MAG: hypothetical protein ACTS3F_10985 [Phycisphaerales bacterium]